MLFINTILSGVPLRVWVWALSLLLIFSLFTVLLVAGVCVAAYRSDRQFHLFGWEFGPVPYDGTRFEHAIIITDDECANLGPGWKTYAPMSGRFAVGAGQGRDINGELRSFILHQDDIEGEYVHQLSIAEMPEHSHEYASGRLHGRRCSGDCTSQDGNDVGSVETTGGSSPHNNLPPYSVVNFCTLEID